jgi:hypothetical protein
MDILGYQLGDSDKNVRSRWFLRRQFCVDEIQQGRNLGLASPVFGGCKLGQTMDGRTYAWMRGSVICWMFLMSFIVILVDGSRLVPAMK